MELLLGLEDADEEELLQLLVGKVDAELLEGVEGKVLETEDVEQPDVRHRLGRLFAADVAVHLAHDPVKQVRVDGLDDGVTRHLRLALVEIDRIDGRALAAAAARHRAARQVALELACLQEVLRRLEHVHVDDLGLVVVLSLELHVAEEEERGERLEDLILRRLRHAEAAHRARRLAVRLLVVDADERRALGLVEHMHLVQPHPAQHRPLDSIRRTGHQLVEDVVVALRVGDRDRARLFEEVRLDLGAGD
mmetsp:Transcript_86585/g.259843  ORF Transcript_86585/g.259843 Transcript_86585/m.259843 type:complete len:250 (-) Transcript_86585:84-833(-)